ncbi:hypothetical protein GAO09_20120 [Rhizobiales bacterium RZME27]|uniref:Uncharacterized protein n=1 Tax=Endobacterium cereale TaxID=2663029 RepID=A0A6A8AC75_9HYPH|nr:hypothetical protein [Endobacterium cereale]MEB2846133.1 hypothetical protein [Endobacterium cereale]MQY48344.1 hypothetical protein [Endobacterium cereale]
MRFAARYRRMKFFLVNSNICRSSPDKTQETPENLEFFAPVNNLGALSPMAEIAFSRRFMAFPRMLRRFVVFRIILEWGLGVKPLAPGAILR